MKKYRKVLATGLIAMMCLTACGGSTSGGGSAENTSAGASATIEASYDG